MKGPKKTSQNGMPDTSLPAILSFLKDTKGLVTWKLEEMAETVGISEAEARRAIPILQLQGYVQPSDDEWMTTAAGESVSGAKTPRFTLKIVNDALEKLTERIVAFNKSKNSVRIDVAVAYGDFLAKNARVQAADVGIRYAGAKRSIHVAPNQMALLTQLREKSQQLHLRPFEDWMTKRTHRKLI